MIHRTIAAALLVGLASPVLAQTFSSPAYDQAAGMAAGKSADASYDGSPARAAVQTQVKGALQTGGLAVETPASATAAATRPSLTMSNVPEPKKGGANNKSSVGRYLLFGAGGAAAGAGIGFLLGGPIGAAIGAAVGALVGLFLCKILR